MKRFVSIGFFAIALACTKADEGPSAPIADGSYMTFSVTDSLSSGPVTYDVRLDFKKRGEVFDVSFKHSGSEPKVEPIKVNRRLVPEDNVISAYSLGRLWLEPAGRVAGKRTPCGTVSKEHKYREWNVCRVDGICGTDQGSRFYEKSTGMLVGFVFSGLVDRMAYVRESG